MIPGNAPAPSYNAHMSTYSMLSPAKYVPPQSDLSFFLLKSLACIFLVIEGSLTRNPSNSLFMITWQPNLDVSVNPNARSSMSFSSSSGSDIRSYSFSSSTMTWHVEHAQDPPQAPICLLAVSQVAGGWVSLTFHFNIISLSDV